MHSIARALNLLHEDGSWFARAHELRLWLLRCDANTRKPALTLVPKFEFHHDNSSAWPVLADAYTRADNSWQLRANNLAADWERRREAFREADVVQPALVVPPAPAGLSTFRTTLAALLQTLAPPLTGLVLVLAPGVVEAPERFADDLAALLGDPALVRARWVWLIDVDTPVPQTLLDALGPECALVSDCLVDPAAQARDLAAMLGGDKPERFGTAYPIGVEPPPRIGTPPPLPPDARDQVLREAGVNPALLEHAPTLRAKLLGAAVALQAGRGDEAIALQREASQLCAGLGMFELEVITRASLASYLSGLGHRGAAKQELHAAIAVAREQQLPRPESQAQLALGLLHNLDREHEAAAEAYAAAGKAAETANEPLLAIESWRMVGQLAVDLGQDQAAVDAWGRALALAEQVDPDLRAASSAPEAARQLAAVYERHAMPAQAATTYAQADALERGEQERTDAGE